jgi:hypothetical protein
MLKRITTNESAMYMMIAQTEVIAAFSSILTLFSAKTRSLMSTMVLWQYVRLRYMLSGYTKMVFGRIKGFLDSYLLSARSPPVVQTVYIKACSFLQSMAEPPRAGQQAAPSCTVM